MQSLVLLVTAPWWIPLARQVVLGVRRASAPDAQESTDRDQATARERAYQRALAPWGAAAGDGRHVPRQLRNLAWATGRRIRNQVPRRHFGGRTAGLPDE